MSTMRHFSFIRCGIGIFLLALASQFFVLPNLGSSVYLSPDETAVAVSSRAFAQTGSMAMDEPYLRQFPWLHPRSFVTQGVSMVPVGFLGLPIILGILWKIFGDVAFALFTPLLAISAAYPIWRMSRKHGKAAGLAGVVVWLTYPAVILYANRGLFPNLPVVCLALWSFFLILEKKDLWRFVVSGVLAGAALTIRPIEAIWVLPWVVVSWLHGKKFDRRSMTQAAVLFFASLVPIGLSLFVAWKTYGTPWAVGYWLRDPIVGPAAQSMIATPDLWPFGLHPRNVWFNFKTYILGFVGLWSATGLAAVAVMTKKRNSYVWIGLSAWTTLALTLVYGQLIYQDHVGVNVASTANSFLRYVLPLAPIFAVAAAVVCGRLLDGKGGRKAVLSALGIVLVLSFFGTWTAFFRDDESIRTTAVELERYAQIRRSTIDQAGGSSIVLSERSDKVFFPDFRAASPLPSLGSIVDLAGMAREPVLVFGTTFDDKSIKDWSDAGLSLWPIFNSENQTLYEVTKSTDGL